MASLASINIVFRANLSQYSSEMQNARRELEKSGKQFQAIGKKMSLAMSVPLLALGGAAIKFGSDYQESLNKADVAFKDTSNQVRSFAKTTLEGFGIAEGSALDMAAQFGDMSTSMWLTTSRASAMSTSLVGLAGDLASFKNIGLDQAQTALNGIFTGETESLKMLGIVMTEANLQQFAYSKGMKTKIKDMTQAQKVELRYAYVMAQTTNAQGDFARTGGGAANQMRIVQESLKQLAADIGQILLPAFTKIVVKINGLLKSFTGLDTGTKKIIVVTAALAVAIGPLLTAYGYILTLIPKIATQFSVLRTSLIGVRIAKLALTVQTLALSAAQNLAMAGSQLFAAGQMVLTGNIVGATQAMNVFKASMIATPWGFVAAAIGVAAVAYAFYTSEVKMLTSVQIQRNKIAKLESDLQTQATQIITTQRTALEGLIYTAKNKYLSDKERQAAIKEINAMSPKYLGNITLEGIETEKTTKAIEAYTAALLKGAMARAAQGKLDELFKKQIDNELALLKAKDASIKQEKEWKKNVTDNILLEKERAKLANLDKDSIAIKMQQMRKKGFDQEVEFLQKIINDNKEYLSLLEQIGGVQSADSGPKKGTIEYYQSLINIQKEIQEKLSTTNAAFAEAETKIQDYQKAIDRISGKRKELEPVTLSDKNASGIAGSVDDLNAQISKIKEVQSAFSQFSFQYQMYAAQINAIEIKLKAITDIDSFESAKLAIKNLEIQVKNSVANANAEADKLKETMVLISAGVADAFSGLAGRLVDSFGFASEGIQGFLKGLLDVTIKLISMMLAQSIANSVAGATAAGAATGPASVVTTPAFIGTAIAGVLAAFAAIPKFETGGIVGGSSYFGDKILARLNSGEMIANQKQQKNLWNMINPSVTAQDMIVQLMGGFELDGNKLRLVLDRTDSRNNRIK